MTRLNQYQHPAAQNLDKRKAEELATELQGFAEEAAAPWTESCLRRIIEHMDEAEDVPYHR
jgi:hypothetical protein